MACGEGPRSPDPEVALRRRDRRRRRSAAGVTCDLRRCAQPPAGRTLGPARTVGNAGTRWDGLWCGRRRADLGPRTTGSDPSQMDGGPLPTVDPSAGRRQERAETDAHTSDLAKEGDQTERENAQPDATRPTGLLDFVRRGVARGFCMVGRWPVCSRRSRRDPLARLVAWRAALAVVERFSVAELLVRGSARRAAMLGRSR